MISLVLTLRKIVHMAVHDLFIGFVKSVGINGLHHLPIEEMANTHVLNAAEKSYIQERTIFKRGVSQIIEKTFWPIGIMRITKQMNTAPIPLTKFALIKPSMFIGNVIYVVTNGKVGLEIVPNEIKTVETV